MRVLITGGAGFIGSNTCAALVSRGHTVRILDNLDPQIHGPANSVQTSDDVQFMKGDVRSVADVTRALEHIDAVYHFAALTGVGQSMYELSRYSDTNVTGTTTLIETIVRNRVPLRRFVLASSRAVYGEGTGLCPTHGEVYPRHRIRSDLEAGDFSPKCPLCGYALQSAATREERPTVPVSMYGWTKLQQEQVCMFAAETFGLPSVVLRYFNVYGAGQSLNNAYTGIATVFFNRIRSNTPIELYEHGRPLRDFVHVRDVVAANLQALEAETAPGSTFNVGSGMRNSIKDIANAVSSACGGIGSTVDTGKFRMGDIFACVADISRANQVLGYAPSVSLDEGMREFVAWANTIESKDHYDQASSELAKFGLLGSGVDGRG